MYNLVKIQIKWFENECNYISMYKYSYNCKYTFA